jgi:uncharacterized protein
MGWELLPLLPLGILAGLLSGLLGIGGGLVFSPLLLWIGLPPHQALATSTLVIEPRRTGGNSTSTVPVRGLIGVGLVAGLSSGLLGVGGGLVMVPLMVRGLRLGVYQAIRLSTMAVFASSLVASFTFWGDGRAQLLIGLVLGATAASAAQWSAGHLQKVPEQRLVGLIRLLCVLLAVDVGRRAVLLWL